MVKPTPRLVKARKAKPPTAWLTRQQLAAALGMSADHVDRRYRPHFPPSAVKVDGRRLIFHAPRCIAAWNKAKPPPRDHEADVSPALERYRLARASLAELELRDRRRELLSLADLRTIFRCW